MLRNGVQNDYISSRVNLPTQYNHDEIVKNIPSRIKAQAFFSARVSEARILERLREVSDGFSRGEFGLGEARVRLKEFLQNEGYNPHEAGLKNLASTARLNLILNQNATMAKATADYHRMHKAENMKIFPYVRYHSRQDSRTRSAHADLDGKIFHKDDPFLKTHTPPWEFNCRCYLEEITEKEANKNPDLIQKETAEADVKVESKSGFSFEPAHAFEEFDLSSLQLKRRNTIINQAAEAVKNGEIGSCGVTCAMPTVGLQPNPLPGIEEVRQNFEKMKNKVHSELKKHGFDPENLPDYETINASMGKNISSSVKDLFTDKPIEVGRLCYRAQEAVGIPDVPVILDRGNDYHGISHLWRDHKDIFANPDEAVKILKDTLGNSNCRVVVSLKKIKKAVSGKRQFDCLKRIVITNQDSTSYCVLVYDENNHKLNLVSWHHAPYTYGDSEWSLK